MDTQDLEIIAIKNKQIGLHYTIDDKKVSLNGRFCEVDHIGIHVIITK